jgi:hypothetical protein
MPSEYKPNFGVVAVTANTTLSPDAYAGVTTRLAAAAGLTITLPPATGSGASYEFIVGTSITSNAYIVDAPGTNLFLGQAAVLGSAVAAFAANGSTHNRLSMSSTTTGGLAGGRIYIVDSAPGIYNVTAQLNGSGTAATPFAAR